MKNSKNIHPVIYSAPVAYTNLTLRRLKADPASKAEELKSALVKRLSAEYADVGKRLVYQAVNEAHALASSTIVPLLLLPLLAEEKVQSAAAWSARQRSLFQTNPLALAA